jgi:2-polyprenyl-6-hydroxyphenyl methylase/3-demethylubiquinone-9 3-methyltransferase
MSSLNQATIQHFTQDAPDWWNPSGKFKPLHALNPIRMDFVLTALRQHFASSAPKALRILDVGCGGGLIAEPLAKLGGKVTGIDGDPKAIEAASAHAKTMGVAVDYRCAVAEDLVASKSVFDVILALEVIEHVNQPPTFLQTLRQLLRPGGLLILSTLNRNTWSYLGAIVMAERVLGWVRPGTHDWSQFITPEEITAMLQTSGFDAEKPQGITFNPLTRSWALSANTAVNYILCAKAQ